MQKSGGEFPWYQRENDENGEKMLKVQPAWITND